MGLTPSPIFSFVLPVGLSLILYLIFAVCAFILAKKVGGVGFWIMGGGFVVSALATSVTLGLRMVHWTGEVQFFEVYRVTSCGSQLGMVFAAGGFVMATGRILGWIKQVDVWKKGE